MVKAIRTHTLRQPIRSHTEALPPKGRGRHKGDPVKKTPTTAVKPAPKGKKAVTPPTKPAKLGSNGAAPKQHRAKKDGLRPRQVSFLAVLGKFREGHPGLSRKELVEKVGCHATNVTANALGDVGPNARAKREAKTGYPSLITLGYVAVTEHAPAGGDAGAEGKPQRLYKITPRGRKALADSK